MACLSGIAEHLLPGASPAPSQSSSGRDPLAFDDGWGPPSLLWVH